MSNEPEVVEQDNQNQMIKPAGTIKEAKEQFQQYQQLREKLATEDDIVSIKGKEHPKKSFVRKVSRFFNLSCEIVSDEPIKIDDEIIAWAATARASHKGTGQFQEADGSCEMSEKTGDGKTIHNIRAHAITRAKNRAILDLVGFGEVSAEEINQASHSESPSSSHDNEYTIPFGDAQGTPISEADKEDLEWIMPKLDTEHEKYGDRNKELKQAIEDELKKREVISEEQEAKIFKLADKHNIDEDSMIELAESIFGNFASITQKQANKFIERLQNSGSDKIKQAIKKNTANQETIDVDSEKGTSKDSEDEEDQENEMVPPGDREDKPF